MSKKKRAIETAGIIAFCSLYVIFRKPIGGNPLFILPTIVLGLIYFLNELRSGDRKMADFGIRTDNLKSAFWISSLVFIPAIIAVVAVAIFKEQVLPSYFYYTLLFYPIWGISQQFMFQGILLGNLKEFGVGPFSIVVTTLVFTAIHWPSGTLMVFTCIGGFVFSTIYYFRPNILPIGIYHGILGAMIYYIVMDKDPLQKFLAWESSIQQVAAGNVR